MSHIEIIKNEENIDEIERLEFEWSMISFFSIGKLLFECYCVYVVKIKSLRKIPKIMSTLNILKGIINQVNNPCNIIFMGHLNGGVHIPQWQ